MTLQIDSKSNFRINHYANDLSRCRNILSTTHAYRLLIAFSKKTYGIECKFDIKDLKNSDTIWIDFDYNELVDIMNLNIYNKNEANRIVCESFEHLKKSIMFRPDNGDNTEWVSTGLVLQHQNIKGIYSIQLSALCVNMLNGLNGYTNIDIANLCKLESNQQSYLYLLLKSYARLNTFTTSIEDFLTALKLSETKSYQKSNKNWIMNIREKIFGIDKNGNYLKDKQGNPYGCLYNINTKTDIIVKPELIKRGVGKYDIKFDITEKAPKPEKTQLALNAPKQETQIQSAPAPEPVKGEWHEVDILRYLDIAEFKKQSIKEFVNEMMEKGFIKYENGKYFEFKQG